jgi:hypothetical protein
VALVKPGSTGPPNVPPIATFNMKKKFWLKGILGEFTTE